MADETPDVPDIIKVNASPVPSALAALARQITLAFFAYAANKGWFSLGPSLVEQYAVPVVVIAATAGYGQMKTWLLHGKLAALVPFVDDSIARFK